MVYHEEDKPLRGWLVVLKSRQEKIYQDFKLYEGNNSIGRGGSPAKLPINDDGISSEQAMLVCKEGSYRLMDLGSANGTWVNGERAEHVPLNAGDMVRIGKTTMVFVPFTFQADE